MSLNASLQPCACVYVLKRAMGDSSTSDSAPHWATAAPLTARPLQERALRVSMADDGATDGAASTVIAAALSAAAPSISADALLEFAARFVSKGQYAAAAHAYVGAGRAAAALDVVEAHSVRLDDAFADKLAPAERSGDEGEDARRALLKRVARAARKQGLHALAARKYTQVRA